MKDNTPSSPILGELEIQVLEYLWTTSDATVKDVHAYLVKSRATTDKTVQSAMERLYRKGLLSRSKVSHSYRYAALVTKEDLLGDLINDIVGRFKADSHSSAAAILNAAEQMDEQTLDLLEKEIRKRRKERRS